MRRPAPGQPEKDQEEDDPTLIRVPDPDEEDSDAPEDEDAGEEEKDGNDGQNGKNSERGRPDHAEEDPSRDSAPD
jgi:hypothetical protein